MYDGGLDACVGFRGFLDFELDPFFVFPLVVGGDCQGYACAKTLASLASGLALVLLSKFPIIPKGVLWEWFSANGA